MRAARGGAPFAVTAPDPGRGPSPRPVSVRDLAYSLQGDAVSLASWFAITLLAAAPKPGAVDAKTASPPAFTNSAGAPAAVKPPATAANAPADTPRPKLGSGHRAPDFQYQSYDDLWQNLHNVLEHGDVLLVFGASDVDLRTLERERETLVKGGVLPLAVVEKSDRDVWASVRRLGLTFSLMADPRGAIGTQYGVYDASVGRSIGSWFMIDRHGKVRSSGIGMPAQSWLGLASNAFGRPFTGGTQSASTR